MNSKLVPIFYKPLFTTIFAVNAVVCFAANIEVPDILKTPPNQIVLLEAKAEGVQIYECKTQQNDSLKFEWKFKAPEADLYDTDGKPYARSKPVFHALQFCTDSQDAESNPGNGSRNQ